MTKAAPNRKADASSVLIWRGYTPGAWRLKKNALACNFAPQATAPTTLPTHTIPLNKPSCAQEPSHPPALDQRKQHIPLYNAATPNETTCITRQPHGKRRPARAATHQSACFAYREDADAVVGLLQLQRRAGGLSGASFGPVGVAHGENGQGQTYLRRFGLIQG